MSEISLLHCIPKNRDKARPMLRANFLEVMATRTGWRTCPSFNGSSSVGWLAQNQEDAPDHQC
jgi:hypothetical protein